MAHRIAFLTMDTLEDFVCYDRLVIDVLKARGTEVNEVSWRNRRADWGQYAAVVIRSPWDYQQAPEAFLETLEQIDRSGAVLHNSLATVRWNLRKTYLRDVEAAGATIVPTEWLASPSDADLRNTFRSLQSDQVVVKPVVGANADQAYWIRPDSSSSVFELAAASFRNTIALAQPFVDSIQTFGEISLIFFREHFSHAVLKTPKTGDFRVQEEHGGNIQSWSVDQGLIDFARTCLKACPSETLYARVDLVMLSDGCPAVMEIELIEPSLYLPYSSESPELFADAIESVLV